LLYKYMNITSSRNIRIKYIKANYYILILVLSLSTDIKKKYPFWR
jgi:hypothetical protein